MLRSMFKQTKPRRFPRLDSRARFRLLPFAALLTIALFSTLAYVLMSPRGVGRETLEVPEIGV